MADAAFSFCTALLIELGARFVQAILTEGCKVMLNSQNTSRRGTQTMNVSDVLNGLLRRAILRGLPSNQRMCQEAMQCIHTIYIHVRWWFS